MLMSFLKYMDSFAMSVMFILLVIMIYRITRSNKTELTLWFAGCIGLTFIVFLGVNDIALAINPYFTGIVAFTLALFSSGYASLLDTNKKWSPYYTMGIIILALIYTLSAHFGGVVTKVLSKPLFSIILLLSFLILLIGPIWAFIKKKANAHILWSVPGWLFLAYSGWTQWMAATEKLVMEPDPLDARIFTTLFIGLLFITLDFALTSWDFDNEAKSR